MKGLTATFLGFLILTSITRGQGPDVPAAITVDPDGNVYVAGTSMSSSGVMEYVLLSYDTTGQLVEAYHHPGDAAGASIVSSLVLSADRVVMTGSSPTAATGYDIVTVSRKRIQSSIDEPVNRPSEITLDQSYPNPLHKGAIAVITYTLPRSGVIELSVMDITGRVAAVLDKGFRQTGQHSSTFQPGKLPAGTYFYVLRNSTSSEVRKVALLR